MQEIKELTAAVVQGPKSLPTDAPEPSRNERPTLRETVVDRIFIRMHSIYGSLWANRFTSDDVLHAAKAEWGISLVNFSLEEIGNAIEKCKTSYRFAPTLPEFIELCKANRPRCSQFKLPAAPVASRETVEAGLNELKSITGGKR